MKHFDHRHESLPQAQRGFHWRGGKRQRRAPRLLPERGIYSASPPVSPWPPIVATPTTLREVKRIKVRAPSVAALRCLGSAGFQSAVSRVSNLQAVGTIERSAVRTRRIRLATLAERHLCVRVLLHAIVFARSLRNFRWHLNCIGHEFYGRSRNK